MTKLRIVSRFAVTPNSVLYSKTLTLKAKGLYGYIQSKPDGWEFSADRIAEECKEERKTIQNVMKELEKEGLLVRKKFKKSDGTWQWEHQLLESIVPKADYGLFHDNTEKPESVLRSVEKPPIKEEGLSKNNTFSAPTETGSLEEEKKASKPFDSKEWIKSLKDSPQEHIVLIGAYFDKYTKHNFPTKEVAVAELKKNLAPAVWLNDNFDEKDIIKTLRYCQDNYSDIAWNLHTVKKQITHVTAKH